MRGITKGANKMKGIKSEQDDIYARARIAFACSTILGLTWVFALLAVGEATYTFQLLFCIFNSLQGFFIFVFYTARNKEAKTAWRLCLGVSSGRDLTTTTGNGRHMELLQQKRGTTFIWEPRQFFTVYLSYLHSIGLSICDVISF